MNVFVKIASVLLLVAYLLVFGWLGSKQLNEFSDDAQLVGVLNALPGRIHDPMSAYGRNHLIASLRELGSNGEKPIHDLPATQSIAQYIDYDITGIVALLEDSQLREAHLQLQSLAGLAADEYAKKRSTVLNLLSLGLLGSFLLSMLCVWCFRRAEAKSIQPLFAAAEGAKKSSQAGAGVAAEPTSPLAVAIQDISHKQSIKSGHDYVLELKGDDLLSVTDHHYPLIEASICEMVTNAIVHGGRASATRIADGKPATIKVFVGLSKDDNGWVITVADDGEGIDEMESMQHALAKQLITNDTIKQLEPGHGVKLILLEGFSNAKNNKGGSLKSNTLSGIREAVMAVGGKVSLRNRPGVFCEFKLKLPF